MKARGAVYTRAQIRAWLKRRGGPGYVESALKRAAGRVKADLDAQLRRLVRQRPAERPDTDARALVRETAALLREQRALLRALERVARKARRAR